MSAVFSGLAWVLFGGSITMLFPNSRIIGIALFIWAIAFWGVSYYLKLKQSQLISLKSAIRESRCVWAFWYTGQQVVDDNVIKTGKPTSIKKLIVLKPDLNNSAFNYITNLAGNDTTSQQGKNIGYIHSLIEVAKNASSKIDIYYHSEILTYTFTIYDKTPEIYENEPLPKSKNAWVVIQPLEPKRASERAHWHRWVVKNKGHSQDQFEAYYQLFLDIEKRAEKYNG
jgi:hypothetical protein